METSGPQRGGRNASFAIGIGRRVSWYRRDRCSSSCPLCDDDHCQDIVDRTSLATPPQELHLTEGNDGIAPHHVLHQYRPRSTTCSCRRSGAVLRCDRGRGPDRRRISVPARFEHRRSRSRIRSRLRCRPAVVRLASTACPASRSKFAGTTGQSVAGRTRQSRSWTRPEGDCR
jgi:hypothetical protein